MNLKLFKITLLSLLLIISVNAQTNTAPIDQFVEIDLIVTDGTQAQHFEISTKNKHDLPNRSNIAFKINLDHSSTDEKTSYFGVQYQIFERLIDGSTGQALKGLTAPVLIPPVRKKRSRLGVLDKGFPFSIIDTTYIVPNMRYKVIMNLAKFDSEEDYEDHYQNNNNQNYQQLSFISFNINNGSKSTQSGTLKVNTYPNPVINYITIHQTNTTNENAPSPQTPLEVIIFNDKGVKVSEYSLTNTHNVPYNLNISHLLKGIYYFQFSNGVKTQIKTIVKK